MNTYSHQKRRKREFTGFSRPQWRQRAAGLTYLAPHVPTVTHRPRLARLYPPRPTPARFHSREGARRSARWMAMTAFSSRSRRPTPIAGGRSLMRAADAACTRACLQYTQAATALVLWAALHAPAACFSCRPQQALPWHRTTATQDRWAHDAARSTWLILLARLVATCALESTWS